MGPGGPGICIGGDGYVVELVSASCATHYGVEHSIDRMKNYSILTDPYAGGLEDLNRDLDTVAGLVNLRTLFGQIKLKK